MWFHYGTCLLALSDKQLSASAYDPCVTWQIEVINSGCIDLARVLHPLTTARGALAQDTKACMRKGGQLRGGWTRRRNHTDRSPIGCNRAGTQERGRRLHQATNRSQMMLGEGRCVMANTGLLVSVQHRKMSSGIWGIAFGVWFTVRSYCLRWVIDGWCVICISTYSTATWSHGE